MIQQTMTRLRRRSIILLLAGLCFSIVLGSPRIGPISIAVRRLRRSLQAPSTSGDDTRFSASPVPYPDGTAESTFADESELWVRREGRAYEVTAHRTATMEKLVHEYTAERVAESAESFRGLIADRHIIRIESPTPESKPFWTRR